MIGLINKEWYDLASLLCKKCICSTIIVDMSIKGISFWHGLGSIEKTNIIIILTFYEDMAYSKINY